MHALPNSFDASFELFSCEFMEMLIKYKKIATDDLLHKNFAQYYFISDQNTPISKSKSHCAFPKRH